jgi:hypothetical protein
LVVFRGKERKRSFIPLREGDPEIDAKYSCGGLLSASSSWYHKYQYVKRIANPERALQMAGTSWRPGHKSIRQQNNQHTAEEAGVFPGARETAG